MRCSAVLFLLFKGIKIKRPFEPELLLRKREGKQMGNKISKKEKQRREAEAKAKAKRKDTLMMMFMCAVRV